MPYAIGNVVDSEYENGLMLRIETEHMGNEIAKMLFSSYGLKVQGMCYDLLNSYDIKGIEYEEKDDGTYQFALVLNDNFENDWWTDDFNEAVKGISSSENQEIYLLTDYSYRIAKANINEAVNGTKVTFDNLYYLGIDTIGSEECYLLDLLKEIAEMPRMSAGGTSHTPADYRMDGADEKESENVSVSEKMTQNAAEAICSVYPDAKITSYTDSLWVNMNIVPDEEFPVIPFGNRSTYFGDQSDAAFILEYLALGVQAHYYRLDKNSSAEERRNAVKDFYKKQANRRSSIANGLHISSKLWELGLGILRVPHGGKEAEIFAEHIHAADFTELDVKKIEPYYNLEHERWMAYMRTEGWCLASKDSASVEDIRKCYENYCTEFKNQNYMMKLHPALAPTHSDIEGQATLQEIDDMIVEVNRQKGLKEYLPQYIESDEEVVKHMGEIVGGEWCK